MKVFYFIVKEKEIEIQKLFNKCKELKILYEKNLLSKNEYIKQLKEINKEIQKIENEIFHLKKQEPAELYRYIEFENSLCTCPKMDNKALVGLSVNRWYSQDCPIHGDFLKEEHKDEDINKAKK